MIVCLPIPVYHKITEEREGETIGIFNLSFDFLLNIEEDIETGNAILVYKNDTEIETLVPFTSMLAEIGNYNGGMMYLNITDSKKISKNFNAFCKVNNL